MQAMPPPKALMQRARFLLNRLNMFPNVSHLRHLEISYQIDIIDRPEFLCPVELAGKLTEVACA